MVEDLEDRRLLATLTVNSTADSQIANDGIFTLREAIVAANENADHDSIQFNIPRDPATPGEGVHRIEPGSELPRLLHAVSIDGRTQPDYSGTPLIVLDGSSLPADDGNGLFLRGGNSELVGLSIVRFPEFGVWVDGPGSTHVFGNYLGLEPDGVSAAGQRQIGNSLFLIRPIT